VSSKRTNFGTLSKSTKMGIPLKNGLMERNNDETNSDWK